MIAGFGKRMSERNTQLIEQETQRRKDLVSLYTMLYNQPNMPPEMRQMFLEFMMEIPQLDPLKKMPPKYTDLGKALDTRRELPGPTMPLPSGDPDEPPPAEPAPAPDPGTLMGAAAPPGPPIPTPPEVAEVTRPPVAPEIGPPAPALEAPAPGAPVPAALPPAPGPPAAAPRPPTPGGEAVPMLPGMAAAAALPPPPDPFAPTEYEQRPAPGMEFTPRERAILDRVESGRATATEINEAQMFMRANIPPPGITFPRPVPVSAGGAVAHVDPVTAQPTGEMTYGPEATGTTPGAGTFDAYVGRALQVARDQKRMQGLPGILTPQEENDIVEESQETYPRERAGQWEKLFDIDTGVEIGSVNYERNTFRPIPLGMAGEYSDAARLRSSPLSDQARKDKSALEVMLQDTQRLDVLGDRNRDKIGPGWGRYYGAARQFYDIGEEANRMYRIANNLSELLLRARSGAQINEDERANLERMMPNPAGTVSAFFANLKEFQLESMRLYRKRFRVEYQPLMIQEDGSVWEITPTGSLRQIDQLF
jgi:hypothetical protein